MAKQHHATDTLEWRAWNKMRKRCGVVSRSVRDPNRARGVPKYVARGMAEEWKHDFSVFLAYVRQHMGPHPGSGWSLDRIDNEQGYFPGNIRWMPLTYQRRQGGLVPHDSYNLTDEGREIRRRVGREVGQQRAQIGKRLPNGQFARMT